MSGGWLTGLKKLLSSSNRHPWVFKTVTHWVILKCIKVRTEFMKNEENNMRFHHTMIIIMDFFYDYEQFNVFIFNVLCFCLHFWGRKQVWWVY